MLMNMRFVVEGDCPDCDGFGVLYDTNWNEFRNWRRVWEKENPPPGDGFEYKQWKMARKGAEEDWWAEAGYPGGREQWPLEELDCGGCNGTGSVQMSLSPQEARDLLGL